MFVTPAFVRHACTSACSAAVSGVIRRRMWNVWPPVLSFATIFGTVPSWCSATSSSPCETAATPGSDFTVAPWLAGKVSCVPGRKKSCTKCAPGLPSFERSVITELFAWISSPPPPPPKPPVSVCAARVTVRSVPIVESGSSAVFWAWSRPRERPEIAITRPDAEREPEHRQDRPGAPAQQLAPEIAEIEHLQRSKSPPPNSRLSLGGIA